MMKKEYIQPEAKEIEVKLPVVLAANSIKNEGTGYSFGGDDSLDDDEVDAGDGL